MPGVNDKSMGKGFEAAQQTITASILNTAKKLNIEYDKAGKYTSVIAANQKKLSKGQEATVEALKEQRGITAELLKIEASSLSTAEKKLEKEKLLDKFAAEAAALIKQREENEMKYMTAAERAEIASSRANAAYSQATKDKKQAMKEYADAQALVSIHENKIVEESQQLANLEQSKSEYAKEQQAIAERQAQLAADNKSITQDILELKTKISLESDLSKQEELQQQVAELEQQKLDNEKEYNALKKSDSKLIEEIENNEKEIEASKRRQSQLADEEQELRRKASEKELAAQEAARKKEEAAVAKRKKEREAAYKEEQEKHRQKIEEEDIKIADGVGLDVSNMGGKHFQEFTAHAQNEGFSSGIEGVLAGVTMALMDAAELMAKSLNNIVENAISLVEKYQLKINYRIEAIEDLDFDKIWKDVQKNVGNTGLVSQQKVIEKIGDAVDQGIAYNVEQRAFLATLGENLQSTFDAFSANLNRLVRIQQQDSTAQRLGLEKALNDMFNQYFSDSSYLQTAYDNVASALFEMSATQSRNQAVETEFIIQKWLGSLYSLGASDNIVQQIATGLGYLGSGNVQALSGNTALTNLLALSSSRAGLDYAELLTEGLNASDANELLKAMVEYLAEIADSTAQNKVVTSAFGNVFGMSVSDIKSFQNLQSSIEDIYNETLSYTQTTGYLQNSLSKYRDYIAESTYMQTVIDNIKLGIGKNFSEGPGYYLYKAVNMLQDLTGGINIDVHPWGIGTHFNVLDMIKAGMFGFGLISSLSNGGLMDDSRITDLDRWGWNYRDVNTRGTGFSLRTTGGTSVSTSIGNASSSDVENQTIREGTEKTDTVSSVSGKGQSKGPDDIYNALVYPGQTGMLSELNSKVVELDDKMRRALELSYQLSNEGIRKAVNVNIQKINGADIEKGAIRTQPDDNWIKLIKAAAVLIKYGELMDGFNDKLLRQIMQNAEDKDEYTLQDFLDLFVPILESDTGVPVRLESADSMTNLMADLTRR